MGKSVRQNKILEIIYKTEVGTQEELADILNANHFNVTQATVSRDIKQLGLIKVAGKTKKYRYAAPSEVKGGSTDKLLNLFKNCVLGIEVAKNLVLIKTLGGNANSAGVMVDKLRLSEVVGSVAGDDTLLVVTKTDEDAEEVKRQLTELF